METQHATPELFKALSDAQGEIENASKNAANPHYRSKYADLSEILNTIRPVFAKHGLSLSQSPSFDGSFASVTTVLSHSSGGYITGMASCVPAKTDAQGIGSATTYLRRYAAAGFAGIAQEDDDGNTAAHDKKPRSAEDRVLERIDKKPVSKPNPYLKEINELQGNIAAVLTQFGVVASVAEGEKWFKTQAQIATATVGKKTADMSRDEFMRFSQIIDAAANDAVDGAGAVANQEAAADA